MEGIKKTHLNPKIILESQRRNREPMLCAISVPCREAANPSTFHSFLHGEADKGSEIICDYGGVCLRDQGESTSPRCIFRGGGRSAAGTKRTGLLNTALSQFLFTGKTRPTQVDTAVRRYEGPYFEWTHTFLTLHVGNRQEPMKMEKKRSRCVKRQKRANKNGRTYREAGGGRRWMQTCRLCILDQKQHVCSPTSPSWYPPIALESILSRVQ